ncbi:hypothetical protein LINGRAHAP2_LOCUS22883, partial [Linum grandiflorum]
RSIGFGRRRLRYPIAYVGIDNSADVVEGRFEATFVTCWRLSDLPIVVGSFI